MRLVSAMPWLMLALFGATWPDSGMAINPFNRFNSLLNPPSYGETVGNPLHPPSYSEIDGNPFAVPSCPLAVSEPESWQEEKSLFDGYMFCTENVHLRNALKVSRHDIFSTQSRFPFLSCTE